MSRNTWFGTKVKVATESAYLSWGFDGAGGSPCHYLPSPPHQSKFPSALGFSSKTFLFSYCYLKPMEIILKKLLRIEGPTGVPFDYYYSVFSNISSLLPIKRREKKNSSTYPLFSVLKSTLKRVKLGMNS